MYNFAADPDNLPKWAEGLAKADVRRVADTLVVDSPMGEVTVSFVSRNGFGVLDHDVTLPSGTTINNPLRVIAHPDGAEVIFSVRQIGMTDEEFDRDCRMVADDLAKLKRILES
ncbi:SRPBCC family protein [Ammonicoccus fulvus]|uniref:SRPBCC family protein n=1 Tax=Ammonicoccus fulvus TaxID=3138240 RepID=A0ABZ3FLJ3_9ACTN